MMCAAGVTLLSALFSACHVVTIRRAMIKLVQLPGGSAGAHHPPDDDEHEEVGLLSDDDSVPSSSKRREGGGGGGAARRVPPGRVPELLLFKMALSLLFLVPAALMEHGRLSGSGSGVTAWTVLAAAADDAPRLEGKYFGRCAATAVPRCCTRVPV